MRIYTIGHGETRVDAFLDLLGWHGVTHLVDVRPEDQLPEPSDYQPENLRVELLVRGIMYANMSQSLGRGVSDDPDEWKRLQEVEDFIAGLQKLIQVSMMPDRVVCILGSELLPERCTRAMVVGKALNALRVDVIHIEGKELTSHRVAMIRAENNSPLEI